MNFTKSGSKTAAGKGAGATTSELFNDTVIALRGKRSSGGFYTKLQMGHTLLICVLEHEYGWLHKACFTSLKLNIKRGTGQMGQQLRTLDALLGDPDSTPSTHVVAHNCLEL